MGTALSPGRRYKANRFPRPGAGGWAVLARRGIGYLLPTRDCSRLSTN
jgi:hypothetical protein